MASIEIASVVSGGAGWTKVRTTDGRTLTIKGTRSTRNNNPGNIKYGKWARRHGAVGSDGRFAVFPSRERGYQAIGELLTSSAYKDKSIKQAIAKYAPAFENNTTAYTNAVARAVGVDKDTKIADLTPEQQAALANAIKTVEAGGGGKATAYDENGTLVATISGRGGAQFAPGQQTITPDIRSAIAATDIFNAAPQVPQGAVQTAALGGIPLGEARQSAPQVPDGLPIQLASAPRAIPQITRENAGAPIAAGVTRGPNWTPPPLGTSAMMQPTPQPLGPPGQRNLTPREMGRFVPAMPQTVPSQPSASIGLSMQPVGARGMPTQPPAPPLSAPREVGSAPNVAESQRVPMEWAGPPGAATQAGLASALDPLGVLSPSTVRDEAARLVGSGSTPALPVASPAAVPRSPVPYLDRIPRPAGSPPPQRASGLSRIAQSIFGGALPNDPVNGVWGGLFGAPREQAYAEWAGKGPIDTRIVGQGGKPGYGVQQGQTTQQAIQGIMDAKAPTGFAVQSRSDPSVTITSLGPQGYAHTNSKYGWTETYGPDGQSTGVHQGKTVTVSVDPTTGRASWSLTAVDPATGFGKARSQGWQSRQASRYAAEQAGKAVSQATQARGLAGLFSGLFGPSTFAPAITAAPAQPTGALGYFSQQGPVGNAAGMGGLGGSPGYGGSVGFSGAFSEGAHSNSTSSRGL